MFSVLMSVYNGENVQNFKKAINSVLTQTLPPSEIILIRDGIVYQELQDIINVYVNEYPALFSYIPLNTNVGLGNALKIGVEKSKYDIIARMDTDDIAVPDRFEKQMDYMCKHPEIDVLGGQIIEFVDQIDRPIALRIVPQEDNQIKKFLRKRNAFNHMTVIFRKNAVLKAGNYQDMHFVEDYYLWCRMLLNQSKFANLEDVLVYARVGEDMYQRRGGYKYFCSWKRLEKFKLEKKITGFFRYFLTLSVRFNVQVVCPNKLRGWIMKCFARKKQEIISDKLKEF